MPRLPAVFFGHGSPMNALAANPHGAVWRGIGAALPKPKAILMVSAHWYGPGLKVTAMAEPRTIHDFGGFPDALYALRYPAPGSPELAARVQSLVAAEADQGWGLDHGTWSVLIHAYPGAEVPVVQLSLNAGQDGAFHYRLGQKLSVLRDEGVLLAGSGNVVHNLRLLRWGGGEPYDWAWRCNQFIRTAIETHNHAPLMAWQAMGADGRLAIPTPEHYLPLLVVLGARRADETVRITGDVIEMGSIGMMNVLVG